MERYLIAEIGNNHLGDMDKAKEYIRAALDSGADYAKFQAFKPENITTGSMDESFYKQCALSLEQYIELAMYCHEVKIKPLFSIFDEKFNFLPTLCDGLIKFSANQVSEIMDNGNLENFDYSICIMSFEQPLEVQMHKAKCMAVTKYMSEKYDDFVLSNLAKLESNCTFYGISDHCITIEPLLEQIAFRDMRVIEKHFVLPKDKNNIFWKGKIFRDSVHSATPKEFEKINKAMGAKWNQ